MATTLRDLMERRFPTVKAFAEAWGVKPGKASDTLNGHRHHLLSRQDIQQLASLFMVSFTTVVSAADETFVQNHYCSYSTEHKLYTIWEKEDRANRHKRGLALRDLMERRFPTVKAFAEAWGVSPGKAGDTLNGYRHHLLSREDIQQLALLFKVSFEEVLKAADETYILVGVGPNGYRNESGYNEWSLYKRWGRHETHREQSQSGHSSKKSQPFTPSSDYFHLLGLSSNAATEEEIKRAFRSKVKALADGKGGYTGDMDKLVQAKERALVHARRRTT